MDDKQAHDLGERFRRAATKGGAVEELQGADARDFVFVAERPQLVGSFKISGAGPRPFFVSIVSGSVPRQNNYQLLVMEKRKGSPMLGTSRHNGTNLVWRYNPTKQSGDNAKRKVEFVRLTGTDSIAIPLPEEDIGPFADQVVRALALRHKADAAGGTGEVEPDAVGEDDEQADAPTFWKVSPGEVGSEWGLCRDKQCIVIGWKELGDLSGIDEEEFDRRAAAAREKWAWGAGVSQAWKFRNIRAGDRLVANAGTKRVLGIGTVTGPYQFVPDGEFPHRLPVRWDDITERVVDMPGWKRTLVRLTESTFNTLTEAQPVGSIVPPALPPVAAPAGGIDFDGVIAQLESRSLSFPAELLAAYLLALQTRRFVLLTGISGTGKTQLALEVAKLFSPRIANSGAVSDGPQIVIGLDMLKRGRFVVPASLAKEFDALNGDERRLEVRLLGRPVESMAVYKDPARPNLLIVLLSGEEKRAFQSTLSSGDRLSLRRETVDRKEVLVADRSGTASTTISPTYELVAVRPDWTDSRALLGFYNPLTRAYAPTPTLELLLRAHAEVSLAVSDGRPPRPFFLIFDEMNLARVEHYFSDFISAMESGEELALHDDEDIAEEVPRRLGLPSNLFVVGTVNVDETTYMFSPKVLDRAFVLEFNDVDLDLLSGRAPSEEPSSTPLALSKLAGGLKLFGRATDDEWLAFEALADGELRRLLAQIHGALAEDNRHFGYRVAREVARFVVLAAEQTGGAAPALTAALDVAILAKVLPKLNGTQAELDGALRRLFRIAVGAVKDAKDDVDAWSMVDGTLHSAQGQATVLPRTATKLWRMQKRLRANGFVSFIE